MLYLLTKGVYGKAGAVALAVLQQSYDPGHLIDHLPERVGGYHPYKSIEEFKEEKDTPRGTDAIGITDEFSEEEIRRIMEEYRHVPILVLTCNPDYAKKKYGFRAGVGYLLLV